MLSFIFYNFSDFSVNIPSRKDDVGLAVIHSSVHLYFFGISKTCARRDMLHPSEQIIIWRRYVFQLQQCTNHKFCNVLPIVVQENNSITCIYYLLLLVYIYTPYTKEQDHKNYLMFLEISFLNYTKILRILKTKNTKKLNQKEAMMIVQHCDF